MLKNTLIVVCVLILIVIILYGVSYSSPQNDAERIPSIPERELRLLNKATFICQNEKLIDVSFSEVLNPIPSTTTPELPPGLARVALVDGRSFDLPQTISASGARYANADESFVFWNKGNAALVQENGTEGAYQGCMILSSVSTEMRLPVPFVSSDVSFSLRLPSVGSDTTDGYAINEQFVYTSAPSSTTSGVQFVIPALVATGTNLSADSYFSVEHSDRTGICEPSLFLDGSHATSSLLENGLTYTVASSSNAGAGNRYDETVYVISGSDPCIAIRTFVHYTVFENYASGTISQFDVQSLKAIFDQIRQTITFNF